MDPRLTTTAPRAVPPSPSARGDTDSRSRLLVLFALALGCEAPDDPRAEGVLAAAPRSEAERVGSLSVPLVTPDSALYRLRRAVFKGSTA